MADAVQVVVSRLVLEQQAFLAQVEPVHREASGVQHRDHVLCRVLRELESAELEDRPAFLLLEHHVRGPEAALLRLVDADVPVEPADHDAAVLVFRAEAAHCHLPRVELLARRDLRRPPDFALEERHSIKYLFSPCTKFLIIS